MGTSEPSLWTVRKIASFFGYGMRPVEVASSLLVGIFLENTEYFIRMQSLPNASNHVSYALAGRKNLHHCLSPEDLPPPVPLIL